MPQYRSKTEQGYLSELVPDDENLRSWETDSDQLDDFKKRSEQAAQLQRIECRAAEQQVRPSVLYRPSLSIDGNKWCALYGKDLQSGVAGFGDSPEKAMQDFDLMWCEPFNPFKPK